MKKRNNLVQQDNRVTQAKSTLTLTEKNCLVEVFSNLQEKYPVQKQPDGSFLHAYDINNIKNEKVTISRERMLEVLGEDQKGKVNNLYYLRLALRGLVHKPFYIEPTVVGDDWANIDWVEVNWLNYAKYDSLKQEFEVEVSDQVITYIINKTGNFTQLNRLFMYELGNRYSQRFYEFCCQVKKVGWFTMTEDEIREKLYLYKYDAKEKSLAPMYTNPSQFRTKVLEKAREGLLENFKERKIDCYFEYKPIKYAHGKSHPIEWFFAVGTTDHKPEFKKIEQLPQTKSPAEPSLFDDYDTTENESAKQTDTADTVAIPPNLALSTIEGMLRSYLPHDAELRDSVMKKLKASGNPYIVRVYGRIHDRRMKYNKPGDNFSGILRQICEQDILRRK